MKRSFSLILIGLLVFSSCAFIERDTKVIIGYVRNVSDGEQLPAHKFTHINYAFANIVDGKLSCEYKRDTTSIAALVKLKSINPDLKLLISVGGWGWSGNFSDMALNEESRKLFIKSCLNFLDYSHFDGIDLDWEYPGQSGAGNTFRKEDKQNFTLLLKELRKALGQHQILINRKKPFLLTIATGANENYILNTELDVCQQYLDFVNIMTYDFGANQLTGHHSNFDTPELAPHVNSVKNAVKIHLQAGVPAHKIVVGVPFYGRVWTGVKSNINHGLYQPISSGRGARSYEEIVQNLKDKNYFQGWDDTAKSPFIFNSKIQTFVSYDNSKSLEIKYNYIRDNKLAGFMFWDYHADNGHELLDVLNSLVNGE